MINRSTDDRSLHLHRHTFEVTSLDGTPLSGLTKNVLVVPAIKAAELDSWQAIVVRLSLSRSGSAARSDMECCWAF